MTDRTETGTAAPPRGLATAFANLRAKPFFTVPLAIVMFYGVLTVITGETFTTSHNQITIMRAAAVFLILAVGQTLGPGASTSRPAP